MGPYTSVIGPQEGQESTFSKVMEPMLKSFNDGYNCTAFVYGQTGSGKTHSLFGPPKFFASVSTDWGFCPKVIQKVLNNKDDGVSLYISAVEIYFDDCFDLL